MPFDDDSKQAAFGNTAATQLASQINSWIELLFIELDG